MPLVLVGAVLLGASRGVTRAGVAALPTLAGRTLLFAGATLALAWLLALALRPAMPRVLHAIPPVVVGTLLGTMGALALPASSLGAWLLAVLATAIVVAPRLAAELAISVSPTRLELQRAAVALGGTPRQAARLAAAADRVERGVLLRGLAAAATEGVAALAVWRLVGAHELAIAGTAMLQDGGGIALSLVVLLALPAALRPGSTRPSAVAVRSGPRVAVTP